MKTEEEQYFEKGCEFMDKGDYDSAITEFTTAINLKPNEYAASYENRGVAKMFKGNFQEAIADFLQSYNLRFKEFQEALAKPKSIQNLARRDLVECLFDLSSCYMQLEDKKSIRYYMEQFTKYFPYDEPNLMLHTPEEIDEFRNKFEMMADSVDSSRHENQIEFSQNLIDYVFNTMCSSEEYIIYYNIELNTVQQEVNGYLTDALNEDQSAARRSIYNRTMSSEVADEIIAGVHYLIPRLEVSEFFNQFRQSAVDNEKLQKFINAFEVSIDEELQFRDVRKNFFKKLDNWFIENGFDINESKKIVNKTKRALALEFLNGCY